MPLPTPALTALQLLDAYLELLAYSPNRFTWQGPEIADNPFRNFLYRKLQSLCRALDVSDNFLLYPSEMGEQLLAKWPAEQVVALFQEMEAFLSEKTPGWLENQDQNMAEFCKAQPRDVQTVFGQFFKFLEILDRLQRFNNSWLMSSSAGAQFSILKTEAILDSLDKEAIEQVRHFLSRVIDPAGRAYSQAELVERFGFPTNDRARLEGESE